MTSRSEFIVQFSYNGCVVGPYNDGWVSRDSIHAPHTYQAFDEALDVVVEKSESRPEAFHDKVEPVDMEFWVIGWDY